MKKKTPQGKVFLVGAGPGDPDLITVKGKACIQAADVIVCDYLATPALLKYAAPKAEIIDAGKKGGAHTLTQDETNALLVKKALEGHTVTRLKGGDPYIFGRGGEEAETLAKAGIPFEVVPGITSAAAATAYAGIPLTHRRLTATVCMVTGHEDPTKTESKINWQALANLDGTLVFFMGVKNLSHITGKLLDCGMPADTPVALVRWGTTPRQVTVSGTLETIEAKVQAAGLKAPAIIVMGRVVELRPILKWFEDRPLMGKRIVVTRARHQASDLVKRLSDLGAECMEYPTIKIVPPDDWGDLDQAVSRLDAYNWLIFTSINGVERFFERLFKAGKDVRAMGRSRIAVIGPATAVQLERYGLKADIIPQSYQAESVVAAFADIVLEGQKILVPRAKEARPLLVEELRNRGAQVDEVCAYQTEKVTENAAHLSDQLKAGVIDMVTFTSSSTVRNFKGLLSAEDFEHHLKGVTIAAIGPITADTATALGFKVHLTADTYTIPGLCEAICEFYPKSAP